jgi:hypothetical protein
MKKLFTITLLHGRQDRRHLLTTEEDPRYYKEDYGQVARVPEHDHNKMRRNIAVLVRRFNLVSFDQLLLLHDTKAKELVLKVYNRNNPGRNAFLEGILYAWNQLKKAKKRTAKAK